MKKSILLGLATVLSMAGPSVSFAEHASNTDSAYWPKANTAKKQRQKNGKREHKNRHKKGRP